MTRSISPITPPRTRVVVSTQMLCAGAIETNVFTVPAPSGHARQQIHIGLQIGRALIYIEDQAALARIVRAVQQAATLSHSVFSPEPDAFDETEARARRKFERTGDVAALRR